MDISDRDCYVLDIFRVVGGTVHDKFTGSYFGSVTTNGLTLGRRRTMAHGAQLRNLQWTRSPKPGWSVDWKIEDRYKYLAPGADVHLRYTDLTSDAQPGLAEAWITYGGYDVNDETWVPRVLARRTGKAAPLESTFVAVLEPYEKSSNIASIRRLPLKKPSAVCPDSDVAVEITLADGRRDLIVARDAENSRRPATAHSRAVGALHRLRAVHGPPARGRQRGARNPLQREVCGLRRTGVTAEGEDRLRGVAARDLAIGSGRPWARTVAKQDRPGRASRTITWLSLSGGGRPSISDFVTPPSMSRMAAL